MTEARLEQRLRAWYRAEATDVAPASLRERVSAIPTVGPYRPIVPAVRLLLVAALLALVAAGLAAGAAWLAPDRPRSIDLTSLDLCGLLRGAEPRDPLAIHTAPSKGPKHGCVMGYDDRYAVPHLVSWPYPVAAADVERELLGVFALRAWAPAGPGRWTASRSEGRRDWYYSVAVHDGEILFAVTGDSPDSADQLADEVLARLDALRSGR